MFLRKIEVNTQKELANELCKILHRKLERFGYYPALTGGCLFRNGKRKDIDIVIFRNRQKHKRFEIKDIEHLLEKCGFSSFKHFGFVTKAMYGDTVIDFINPESKSGDYYVQRT